MAEKVALFHQCRESDLYHENLEYAVVEIADGGDGPGEVIGTSLWNYAMPLIRYRMGDLARPNGGEPACRCGRGLPLTVSGFEGRSDDIIVTPERRFIPAVNFYTLMYHVENVRMFKITQDSLESVTVEIVPSGDFTDTNKALLEKGLRDRLGESVRIEIKVVPEIKRSQATGKIRCVESHVKQI